MCVLCSLHSPENPVKDHGRIARAAGLGWSFLLKLETEGGTERNTKGTQPPRAHLSQNAPPGGAPGKR